jgi:hypothetical protein
MIPTAVASGVTASAYPKLIAANTQWNTFNVNPSGRRTYNTNTTFASPSFTDSPGWTWPAGGPLVCPGYQLQMSLQTDRIEDVIANQHDHQYALVIGASGQLLTNVSQAAGTNVQGPMTNESAALSGAVTFRDFTGHSGGTAFVGNCTLRYQYVRS